MSSDRVTILSGRRLVAGAAADSSQLRVLPVQRLTATLTVVSAAALLLSLGLPLLLVHGSALIFPPLAACCGGVWGVVGYRRRELRHVGEVFARVPESAVRVPVGEVTLVVVMHITFIAGSVAAVIAGAGHGSPASLAAATSVPPLLYSRYMVDSALAHRGAVQLMRDHRQTLFQSIPRGKPERAVLYVTEELDGAD